MLMGIDHFVENHFARSHIFDRKIPTASLRRKSQTSTTTVKNYLWLFLTLWSFFRRSDHFRLSVKWSFSTFWHVDVSGTGVISKSELKYFYTAFMDVGKLGEQRLDEITTNAYRAMTSVSWSWNLNKNNYLQKLGRFKQTFVSLYEWGLSWLS